MPSLYKDDHAVSGESDISRRRPVISQSRLLTQRNHTSSLPDLDVLAIVRNSQDKLLRADGNSCVFIVGSRPSDHYFRSVCLSVCLSRLSVCLSVCLFVCAVFLSRLRSALDQTRTHVTCPGLVVSPRI